MPVVVRTVTSLCGAGLAQLAVQFFSVPVWTPPGAPMGVWKKSASVVTNESALIVTVLTCLSSASVFSSVRLIALW